MANYLPYLDFPTDYVDLPGANDYVHADLLKEAINDGCLHWINLTIDWLGTLTRSDGQLKDELIRLRTLHPEVLAAMLGVTGYATARASTTANIALAGEQTVDGVALLEDEVCLVKDQTDPVENGVYRVATTDWVRIAPMLAGDRPAGAILCWVLEGTVGAYTSWAWLPDEDEVGTDPITWEVFHQEFRPTLDADTLDALGGTEGTPSMSNRFVTDQDPRLTVFDYGKDGLVPGPSMVTGDIRVLCEDGLWRTLDALGLAPTYVRTDIDTTMEDGINIHFAGGGTIDGIPDPANPSEVANKNYIDTVIASILATTGPLLTWKIDLDALNGILACDGAGAYSVWDPLSSVVTDDSTYGGGAQAVAASIDALKGEIDTLAKHGGEVIGAPASILFNSASWQEIEIPIDGLLDGFTTVLSGVAGRALKADRDCRVHFVLVISAALQSSGGSDTYEFAVAVNGTQVTSRSQFQRWNVAYDWETVVVSGRLDLVEDDLVTVHARRTAGINAIMDYYNANLTIEDR